MKPGYVIIRSSADHSEVQRITVNPGTERKVERVADGVTINLDHERYYLETVYGE